MNTKYPDSLQEMVFSTNEGQNIGNLIEASRVHPEHFSMVKGKTYMNWNSDVHLPSNLVYLELANNTSIKIESSLKFPPTLKHLRLRKFGEFDLENTLQTLSATYMHIGSIDGICFPKSLSHLDLSSNKITSIKNTNIPELLKLTRIELRYNRIKSFGSVLIHSSSNLRYLSLEYNRLCQCNVRNFRKLHTLNLSNNAFPGPLDKKALSLPESLISLKLSNTSFAEMGENFKFPKNLRELIFSGPGIKTFSQNFFDSIPKSVTRLYLSKGDIGTTSSIKLEFPNLTYLSLYGNNITPGKLLIDCPKLETLDLENNAITEFDTSLLPLGIKSVALGSNGMQSIVGSFENFEKLKNLEFGDNKLGPWLKENELILPKDLFSIDLTDNEVTDISRKL
ncbi:uncharacterized protein RJT20DRAFT_147825 [Scheffersomyces xylosifermentans]|uniref:uncharacterized protein n=1 Tax=Scheffersomyces xylosifermentans TaxID=1304137 RepID=UPI00315DF69F